MEKRIKFIITLLAILPIIVLLLWILKTNMIKNEENLIIQTHNFYTEINKLPKNSNRFQILKLELNHLLQKVGAYKDDPTIKTKYDNILNIEDLVEYSKELTSFFDSYFPQKHAETRRYTTLLILINLPLCALWILLVTYLILPNIKQKKKEE